MVFRVKTWRFTTTEVSSCIVTSQYTPYTPYRWTRGAWELVGLVSPQIRHTYLAQKVPWSSRRSFQCEAFPLHFGLADHCDHPKCGWLGCVISGSRGAASARSPDNANKSKELKKKFLAETGKTFSTKQAYTVFVVIYLFPIERQILEECFIRLHKKKYPTIHLYRLCEYWYIRCKTINQLIPLYC